MAKTNYWMLIVFASEAYTVVLPIFLLVCVMIFGFHAVLNIPTFGERMLARSVANSFGKIELLNCFSFVVLLVNLFISFRKRNTKSVIGMVLLLVLNGLIAILVYPATILAPTL